MNGDYYQSENESAASQERAVSEEHKGFGDLEGLIGAGKDLKFEQKELALSFDQNPRQAHSDCELSSDAVDLDDDQLPSALAMLG